MSTNIWLTDEDSDITGYKRAKVGARSDNCSHVRAVTSTVAGPAGATQVTRKAAGAVLAWITDPLDAPALTAAAWALRAWAYESVAIANAGLRLDVIRFTNAEGTTVVSDTTTELPLVTRDSAFTTVVATATQLELGDRLVIKLWVVDAGGTQVAGNTVVVSYNGLYGRAEGDTYVVCPDELLVLQDIPDDALLTVRSMLHDSGKVNPQVEDSELIKYLKQALQTYSVDSPRNVAAYLSGDGTSFNFPLPNKWVWGFSRISSVEFPSDQQIPVIQETIDWDLKEGVLGPQPTRFLTFPAFVPELGVNNIWILYTTKHEYSAEYSTIPAEDFDAVLWLTASYAATYLSSKGAGSTDSSLGADVVNYRDMQMRWMAVAKEFKDLYLKRVVQPDSATPVGSTEQWRPHLDIGLNFLWHQRRTIRRIR